MSFSDAGLTLALLSVQGGSTRQRQDDFLLTASHVLQNPHNYTPRHGHSTRSLSRLCAREAAWRGAHALAIYRYKEWYSSTFHEDAGRLPRRQRQSDSQAVVLLLLTLLTVAIGVNSGLLFCVYCWLLLWFTVSLPLSSAPRRG
jgi:hypothetical protein